MTIRAATADDREQWIGQACEYTDSDGVNHPALITAIHGMDEQGPTSINVLFVSKDPAAVDQYGRQVGRQASLVRASFQSAGGMYFRLVTTIMANPGDVFVK